MANSNDWDRNRRGPTQDWNSDDERNYRNQPFDSDRGRYSSSWGQDRGNYGSSYDSDRYRGEGGKYRGDYDRGRYEGSGNYPGREESDWKNRGYQGPDYNKGNQGSDYNRDRDYGNYNRSGRDWWDKTKDEVSSWFGDEDAERRRRMDEREGPHRGKGPKGYTRSDERIKEDVNDRLNEDSNVDASEIDVTVNNGEVTLSGTVNSRWEKHRAEDLAEAVSGVKDVENRIKVNMETTVGSQTMDTGSSRTYKGATSSAGAFDTHK